MSVRFEDLKYPFSAWKGFVFPTIVYPIWQLLFCHQAWSLLIISDKNWLSTPEVLIMILHQFFYWSSYSIAMWWITVFLQICWKNLAKIGSTIITTSNWCFHQSRYYLYNIVVQSNEIYSAREFLSVVS